MGNSNKVISVKFIRKIDCHCNFKSLGDECLPGKYPTTTQPPNNYSTSTVPSIISESKVNLVVPFAIIAGLSLANSLFFIAMRIFYPRNTPHPTRLVPEPVNPGIAHVFAGGDQSDRESITASELPKLPFTGVAAYTGSFSLGGSFSMSKGGQNDGSNMDALSEISAKGSLALRRRQLKELRYLNRQLSIGSFSSANGVAPGRVGSLRSPVGSIKSRTLPQRAATPGLSSSQPQQPNGFINTNAQESSVKPSLYTRFSTWFEGLNMWKVFVVIMATAFMHIYYGLEITFGTFLTTFANKSPIKLETTEGATITSIFWATFTFWRLPTIFYVEWIGPIRTILINLVVLVIGNIILVPWGSTHTWALYTGTALVGLGASPIWASMFGLLELFFPVTSGIASTMITAAMIGEFIFPTIISGFVACTPKVFVWVALFCSLSVITLFGAITLVCLYKLTEPTLEEVKTNVEKLNSEQEDSNNRMETVPEVFSIA